MTICGRFGAGMAVLLVAAASAAAGDFLSADQTQQLGDLHAQLIFVAQKRQKRTPLPPPPPPAICPADGVRGKGQLTWEDLSRAFHDANGIVSDQNEFTAAFTGAWIKVGEVKDPAQYGKYDPEGLHYDDPYGYGWDSLARSGWIGTFEATAGTLGTAHFGVQMATFNRQHAVKPGSTRHPVEFKDGTASYVVDGYTDDNTGDWVGARLREIHIVKPRDGGKVEAAVVRDSLLDPHHDSDHHFFVQYCKVAD